ncbi:MAG: quinone-dependent dihydroorotate dehydrogenase [Chthoniobacterales bacterium]|nr:quinone-dependent dihydroorotate dehydrogenase [Chthoniobacterales bacterium]
MSGPYERIVRPLLFSLDPETAHHFALGALRLASHFPAALRLLRSFDFCGTPQSLFGLTFRNRIGLAAGFDKNAVALPAWEALGFGFVEIGTITARPQPGNPKPRIFRYSKERALINRLGFNNDGADAIATRLRKLRASGRWPGVPIGINIGKSKATPLGEANADYIYSFRRLRDFADYFVLNVSSPNTPGLRSLQAGEALVSLLRAVAEENIASPRPVLLKIAPDLSHEDLDQILRTCEGNDIAGIIATNTTLDHTAIASASDQPGGLSGAPLRLKAAGIVRYLRSRTTLPIIGVGGIMGASDARQMLSAGAQLIQIYTGLVYGGPSLVRDLAALNRT